MDYAWHLQDKLSTFALTAANFATNGKLPNLTFEKSCSGRDDVAVFDFTSLYSAKCSVRVFERYDRRLLVSIVGDSLHEPFWPSGSGCARGFLGVFDVAWMLRNYGLGKQNILRIMAERENVYKLLAQSKPDNLQKKLKEYTIDPRSRYMNLDSSLQPANVCHLVDTDNPREIGINEVLPLRADSDNLLDPVFFKRYSLLRLCQQVVGSLNLNVYNFSDCWYDGRVLAAIISKYRPELVYFSLSNIKDNDDIDFEHICSVLNNDCGVKCGFNSLASWEKLHIDERVHFVEHLLQKLEAYKVAVKEQSVVNARIPEEKVLRRSHTAMENLDSSEEEDILIRNFLAECREEMRENQITELLKHFDELLEYNNETGDVSEIGFSVEEIDKKNYFNDQEVKHFTKRPVVDKLDPERLITVEKIITGKIEAERTKELYRRKQREAKLVARKMDQRDITELEEKLEKTAMGLPFEKKKQMKIISTKEEKIMVANAAAARELFKTGFKNTDVKYKELDDKIVKAELLLKNNDLAGANAVTRMKQQNRELFATRRLSTPIPKNVSKPLPPPKKVVLTRSVSDRCARGDSLRCQIYSKFCNTQEVCKICRKIVYLAERIHVEGFSLHRRCFSCAFCRRPLRIGNCGQDRDLESYNPRFFCMQHLNVSLQEKIDRIKTFEQKPEDNEVNLSLSLSKIDSSYSSTSLRGGVPILALNSKSGDFKCDQIIGAFQSFSTLLTKTSEKMNIFQSIDEACKGEDAGACEEKSTSRNCTPMLFSSILPQSTSDGGCSPFHSQKKLLTKSYSFDDAVVYGYSRKNGWKMTHEFLKSSMNSAVWEQQIKQATSGNVMKSVDVATEAFKSENCDSFEVLEES